MMTNTTKKVNYPQEKYLKALLEIEGIFEGAMVEYLLLNETAKLVKEKQSLEGLPELQIGVQRRKLNEYALSSFKALKGDNWNDREYWGIPTKITIIENNYPFFDHPDSVIYWGGTFKIGNPFDKYWEVRKEVS
jgi:hypothetical protein